jgi:undecaprenyl-diphosphatase
VLVLVCASLIQLVVGALGPLDGDESLYWEWARHLAGGYFDHPPGVAFLVRLGVELFGVNALGVRSMTVLANLGGALIVVTLARRHGGNTAALRAALIISCMPILTNWMMLATPDTALFLTAMGVLLLVDNALREVPGSTASLRWWLLAGVVLGLAALSKELAILVPVGIVLACLTHVELRPRLREPGPYLACLATAVVIVPLVLWNRDHGWVLLRFALQRGLGVETGSAAGRELEYLGGQAGMASPILFLLLAIAVWGTLRKDRDARRHLLAVSSLVTFGWFAIAALRHPMEVNWVMMAYPPAAVLLAVRSTSVVSRRLLTGGVVLGGAMVLLLYAHTAVPILPFTPLNDPIRRGHGWQEVAERVDAARAAASPHATWIAGNRFQDASQLAFYLQGHPFVFSLNMHSRANQYDFWPSFAQQARPGDGLLLVLDDSVESSIAKDLAPYFGSVTAGERVVAGGARPVLVPKRIWLLKCWQGGWPALDRPGGQIFADPTALADTSSRPRPTNCEGSPP